jgi:hypothetical protein
VAGAVHQATVGVVDVDVASHVLTQQGGPQALLVGGDEEGVVVPDGAARGHRLAVVAGLDAHVLPQGEGDQALRLPLGVEQGEEAGDGGGLVAGGDRGLRCGIRCRLGGGLR